MISASEHVVNLELPNDKEVKSAYLALTHAASKAGFHVIATGKGDIRAVKFFRGKKQPYSLIVNKKSLLFYIRNDALKENRSLVSEANTRFGEKVLSKNNSLNEVRFRVTTEEDAVSVIQWLFNA